MEQLFDLDVQVNQTSSRQPTLGYVTQTCFCSLIINDCIGKSDTQTAVC
ncbi:FDLD family class I lanthipeptide [Tumebacillus flagellatus]|nr:FDLD family class I lanthipeptide [Tumebacillus flagellatus]